MNVKQGLIIVGLVASTVMGLHYVVPASHRASAVTTPTVQPTPRASRSVRPTPTHRATKKPVSTPSSTTPKPTPKRVIRDWFKLSFHPHDFSAVQKSENEWYPLAPGFQSVRNGHVNRGHRDLVHRRVFTVTDVHKTIDGVRAVTVLDQDFDGGDLAEQSLDFYAEDKDGNSWYFGSYTEAYEGGQFVNANDAWLAGVHGATPGITMPHYPRTGTPMYYQAKIPGQEVITGRVHKMGQSRCVPFKCYHDVLIIDEGSEYKFFARGAGGIATDPNYSGGEQEREDLVNVTHLSARGLAEMSAEALKMDKHARSTSPSVFGHSSPAKRSS